MSRLLKVIHKHDFNIIQEAHSLEGRADALELPSGFTALWSDYSSSTAGVGIILNNKFLERFDAITKEDNWIEIVPGYVAILKLKGPEGSLDIVCCYFPTGDKSDVDRRKDVAHTISQHIAPQSEVCTVMSGDFNFVEHYTDRWNLPGAK
jgi:exonuclease III